jgi:hypothetical protein
MDTPPGLRLADRLLAKDQRASSSHVAEGIHWNFSKLMREPEQRQAKTLMG